MQKLRANPSTGIAFTAKNQEIVTGGTLTMYTQPNPVLPNFERALAGGTPKILISRKTGGIGDVLMTTPAIKALSKKFNTTIDYATDTGYLDGALVAVLKGNPYIGQILSWRNINSEEYNIYVDITCPCVSHEIPRARPINRVDLFARHIGISLEDTRLDYFPTPEEVLEAKKLLIEKRIPEKFILVQSNSSSSNRDCPIQKYKQIMSLVVAKQHDIHLVVETQGAESKKDPWRDVPNTTVIHNSKVRQIAALTHWSELVVCPDSAILHLACALKKKTVTLFGPTDPRARINYHPEAVSAWFVDGLPGYPNWYGPNLDGGICWKRLDADTTSNVILDLFNNRPIEQSNNIITFGSYQRRP